MSELATKKDLEQTTTQLRGEMKAMGEGLRGEMKAMGEELRGEMKAMGEELRGEMKAMGEELRGEMKAMGEELRGEMKAMGEELHQHIDRSAAHIANVVAERFRRDFSAVDDKYKDLPGRHKELRDEFETHAADLHLHTRLPPAPAKRVRRPRSLSSSAVTRSRRNEGGK